MDMKKVLLLAILVHLVASVFSTGVYHSDEHFQIIEFAGTKLGYQMPENLPWEYNARMRPAIQPLIVYCVVKAFRFFSFDNPFYEAMFLRLLSAFLGLLCMYLLLIVFQKDVRSERLRSWLTLLSFFLWFLVYLHARFSSETWSGALFFIAVGLYLYLDQKQVLRSSNIFLVGLLLGLSFVIRYQTGFMIIGLGTWLLFIRKEGIRNLIFLSLGFILVFLAGLVMDRWFYGQWTLTVWNYLDMNIIQNKVSDFGIRPWWYYFQIVFLNAVPPYSILLLACFILILFLYPKNILSWIILPFLLVHTLIGHKEMRFLFPLVNIIPSVVVLVLGKFQEESRLARVRDLFEKVSWKWFTNSFWVLNLVLLAVVCLKPSGSLDQFYKLMYDRHYTRLYFMGDENPYVSTGKFWKNFYKRKDLEIIRVENLGEIKKLIRKTHKDLLFMAYKYNMSQDLQKEGFRFRTVFRNLPEWSKHFNINHWQERTKIISLYRIESEKR